MIDKFEVGKKITIIRNSLNYSQEQFAEILDVTPQAVSKWETGHSLPNTEALLRISWISHMSINEILEGVNYTRDIAGVDRGPISVSELLICPECKKVLAINYCNINEIYFECENGHKYYVVDGVIDFHSREIRGELWSLFLKNYEQYLKEHGGGNPNYKRGIPVEKVLREKIIEKKPGIIVDFASGAGNGVESFIKNINWKCTIIFTDLSHRILKWDKRYFEENYPNPYVDYVFLACDCSNIPLADTSVDAVTSYGGFESMQNKFLEGFTEGNRILKKIGCAIYTMSLAEGNDNSKKWYRLLVEKHYQEQDHEYFEHFKITQKKWQSICEKNRFVESEFIKLYGDLQADELTEFPYENEIAQWMGCYVVTSMK